MLMDQFMEAEEVQNPLLLLFQKMQALDQESLGRYRVSQKKV